MQNPLGHQFCNSDFIYLLPRTRTVEWIDQSQDYAVLSLLPSLQVPGGCARADHPEDDNDDLEGATDGSLMGERIAKLRQ